MNYTKLKGKDIARFYSFIPGSVEGTQCVLWGGAKNQYNRGVFWIGGQYGRIHVAARVLYSLYHGVDVPDRDHNGERVVVAHICHEPACLCINHLVLTTQKDNLQMSRDDGRYEGTYLAGEQHPRVKLTEGAVREIRKLYAGKYVNQTQLADLYGVSQRNINAIVNHETWRHI
jgi:hypothetical protein